MDASHSPGLLRGTVQADETWIGGHPKNRHANHPIEVERRRPGKRQGATDKQPILSLVHYETREVRSQIVPDVTGKTLLPAMREQADLANLWLHTDGAKAYDMADPFVQDHIYVDHSAGQYVGRMGASTNLAEAKTGVLGRHY